MKQIFLLVFFLISTMALLPSCNLFDHDDDDDNMAEIPEAVQTFITENFADYSIDEAEFETLCDGTAVLEVELEKGRDEIELVFSAENVLLYEEVEINKSELPAAVTEAISANYAAFTLDKEAERLEFPDGTVQYEVELKNGGTVLEVLFQADGTVICEEEEID